MTSSVLWSLYITIAAIAVVAIICFYMSSRHKTRCPRCGSTSVQATHKKGTSGVYAVAFKYKCLKCQNEWEDY